MIKFSKFLIDLRSLINFWPTAWNKKQFEIEKKMLGAINKSIISPSGNMFAMSTRTSGRRLELNARIIESWPTSHSPDVSLNTYFGCQWFMLRQPLQLTPSTPLSITLSSHAAANLFLCLFFEPLPTTKKKKEKVSLGLCCLFCHCTPLPHYLSNLIMCV